MDSTARRPRIARRIARWAVWGTPAWTVAAYLGISLVTADLLTRPNNRPPWLDARAVSPDSMPWSARTDDGLTLRGWYLPTPRHRHLIILIHGMGGSWPEMAALGRDLHAHGHDVLLFDLRGQLRLFLDPPEGRRGEGHALARQRPRFLHARVRPVLRDGRIRRRAPRRANGRAALRPSGHRGLHSRQGPGRAHQLQHFGRRDRRVHAGGREGPRRRAGAQGAPLARERRLPARRRPVGVPQAAGTSALGADHALDLRPRRAGHPVPRPHQPRQQP